MCPNMLKEGRFVMYPQLRFSHLAVFLKKKKVDFIYQTRTPLLSVLLIYTYAILIETTDFSRYQMIQKPIDRLVVVKH